MFTEILKTFINKLEENEKNINCCGLPQAAALFDMNSKKLVGEVYVNTKVKNKECWDYSFQSSESDTHAEIILLNKNSERIRESKKGSLGILITSHPCKECLKSILDFENDSIKYILYLSKKNATRKMSEFIECYGNEKLLSSKIKIDCFNNYGDANQFSLSKETTERLETYLQKYAVNFLREEFINFKTENKNVIWNRTFLSQYKDSMDMVEEMAIRKFFNWKKDKVIVRIDRLKKWYDSELDEDLKERSKKIYLKHKPSWSIIDK